MSDERVRGFLERTGLSPIFGVAASQILDDSVPAEPIGGDTSGPTDAASEPSEPDQRAQSRVDAYVLVEKDDPFVAGGVPLEVFVLEALAWDALAEQVAITVSFAWKRWEPGVSRNEWTRRLAGKFEVWEVAIDLALVRAGEK